MTAKSPSLTDYRMSASDFDKMMHGAQFDPPPKEAPKTKPPRSKAPKIKAPKRKAR
jgi:hypothetical protein